MNEIGSPGERRQVSVIPANAGIHLALAGLAKGNVNVDPGLRRDDERGDATTGRSST
ncbi:hypothetical protein [Pseudoxanthomonas sp.]|uniref:hypothetical protein n=1 Tax=Pseudoxanthomonas sp. TaxID=1871049 RepID=UPI0028C444CA|nr:hypothetical protein [Pseudoxanthomonas sp.]